MIATALHDRRSIRAYLDQPVEAAMIRDILTTARWAPSGGNLQPWKVIAVSGEARAEVIAAAQRALFANPAGEAGEIPIYPADLDERYCTRRAEAGEVLNNALGIAKDDKVARFAQAARNFQFFDAPVGLFFVVNRNMGKGQWAHIGMFMQSIALAANAHGLGTCMQEAWAMVRKTLHAHFELSDDEILYCGMALGWPDTEAPINHADRARAAVDTFSDLRGFES